MSEFSQIELAFEECDFLKKRFVECIHYVAQEPSYDAQVDFLHTFHALVEKEQSIALRLTLIDDPSAKLMLDRLAGDSLYKEVNLGNINEYYRILKEEIKQDIIDLTGEDLDEPVDM